MTAADATMPPADHEGHHLDEDNTNYTLPPYPWEAPDTAEPIAVEHAERTGQEPAAVMRDMAAGIGPLAAMLGYVEPDDYQPRPLGLDGEGNVIPQDPEVVKKAAQEVQRSTAQHSTHHVMRDDLACVLCDIRHRHMRGQWLGDLDARPDHSPELVAAINALTPSARSAIEQAGGDILAPHQTPREVITEEVVDRVAGYLTERGEVPQEATTYDPTKDSLELVRAQRNAADERALRLHREREADPREVALGSLGERAVEIGLQQGSVAVEASVATLDVVSAADVAVRRVQYLWDQRIPLGAATLMPGEEGIGKTTVGVRIISDQTRGILPGEFHGTPRDVIVLATEDGLEDVFVPRLREAGADLHRVHIIRARVGLDGDKHSVIVPRDLALIGELVRKHNAALVWIDSLVTTLPDELKSIAYKDTAKVLRALGNWAEAERVAVVAPWHLNKASGSDTAVRIMDSRAFRTAVRSMLLVVPDPDAPEGITQGIVALDKANAGTLDVPGLRYRIRSAPYTVAELDEETGETTEVSTSCGVADWMGEVAGDGRQIARDALMPHVERIGTAQEWLRKHLAGGIEIARVDVMAAAEEDGFSEDQIKRASRALHVVSRMDKGQDPTTGAPWRSAYWSLPSQSGAPAPYTPPTAPTAPTGEGSIALIDPIGAGQPQSVQSVQSVVSGEKPPTDRPTGERPACPCGQPLLSPESIEAGSCGRCRVDGPEAS